MVLDNKTFKKSIFSTLLQVTAVSRGTKEVIKCNCYTHDLFFLVNFFQELVTKVFQQMWFSPLKGDENSDVFVKRVVHMTDVVSSQVISLTFKSFSFT